MNNFKSYHLSTHKEPKHTRNIFILATGLSFLLIFSFTKQNSSETTGEFCRKIVLRNINTITNEIDLSRKIVVDTADGEKKIKKLKAHYRLARKAYKEIEFFTEYYSPFECKFYINGPLVPKIEMEINSLPFQPQGFQVIEEALFDKNKNDFETLSREYDLLLSKFKFLENHYTTMEIEENKILDALKLQFIRIMCLTLNGYDCTINKEGIIECAHAIRGIENVLSYYGEKTFNDPGIEKIYSALAKSFKECRKKLNKHPDSDTFDRLNFMIDYLNVAYKNLNHFSEGLRVEASAMIYAVNFKAGSFFNQNSINKQYFSVYVMDSQDLTLQAELGKLLFFDPILSGNNKRACASCHHDSKAFTDGLEKSIGYDGTSKLTRNAPTLINAAYQKLFFHDGRVFNLEGQADAVFNNVFEMQSSSAEIVFKLKQSQEYQQLFREAFKSRPDSVITFYAVIKSITEFIKTLDSRNSKFDKYLRGDRSQLAKDEINGYNLFSGKALCGSCHFFPLFNGTVPPMFNDNEFEVIGVPESMGSKNIDPDPGRRNITGSEIHEHAFKTPTVRNIALTGPYMHNGVYNDLDSILVFYNRGGGSGSGFTVKNQTLPFDSLGLSKKELGDLKKFLLSLNDTSNLPKGPLRLPKFNNDELNNRKIGGQY